MTLDELHKLMSYNVTSLFTMLLKHRLLYSDFEKYYKNSYGQCLAYVEKSGNLTDDYVFHVFKYSPECEKLIEKHFECLDEHEDTIHVGYYIVVVMNKWSYMSGEEWQLLQQSNYYDFKDSLFNESRWNHGANIHNSIIIKSDKLADLLELYIGEDVKKRNIYWKAYLKEEEILNLDKLANMKILGYNEEWLLEQLDKASKYDKIVYEKVLKNSFEITAPAITGLQALHYKEEYDFKSLHERLESFLEEKTGKKQYRIDILGTKFSILPNEKDFAAKLKKACKQYNMTDMTKVERCLKSHLDKLQPPLLHYYILHKERGSQLATDYESFEEESINEKIQEAIKNKDMFG